MVTGAFAIAAAVPDPELPVLTIEDLGILRSVEMRSGVVEVEITPTYSGCPAMEAIRNDIISALHDNGYREVEVRTVLSPAWSTDWISEAGKAKLEEFGIAPPRAAPSGPSGSPVLLTLAPRCPHCGSPDTRELSRFGSTACKAIWTCGSCLEPFDQVKPL